MPPMSGTYSSTRPARTSRAVCKDHSRDRESARRTVCFDRFACRLERKSKCFLRDTGHKRFDHPPESRGNIPRQRSHLALHVNASVPLFHPPPGLHPPHVPAIVARSFFAFIRLAAVFIFRNAHRRTAAVSFSRCIVERLHSLLVV